MIYPISCGDFANPYWLLSTLAYEFMNIFMIDEATSTWHVEETSSVDGNEWRERNLDSDSDNVNHLMKTL